VNENDADQYRNRVKHPSLATSAKIELLTRGNTDLSPEHIQRDSLALPASFHPQAARVTSRPLGTSLPLPRSSLEMLPRSRHNHKQRSTPRRMEDDLDGEGVTAPPVDATQPIESNVKHTYNLYLAAYDAGFDLEDDSHRFLRIAALQKPSKKVSRQLVVTEALSSASRPSLLPKQEEMDLKINSEGQEIAVWVGMRPKASYLPAFYHKGENWPATGDPATKQTSQKGQTVNNVQNPKIYPTQEALRVVVPRDRTHKDLPRARQPVQRHRPVLHDDGHD